MPAMLLRYRRQQHRAHGALLQPARHLEYPQAEKAGPPFSVEQAEVDALFAAPWRHSLLERRDILDQEPRFREEGLSALDTAVYHLTNRHL